VRAKNLIPRPPLRTYGEGVPDRAGVRFAVILTVALFSSCNRGPPGPEVFLGAPGDAAECTLSKLQERFALDDPFSFVVDAKGPFPGERLTIQSVRVDAGGVMQEMVRQETLTLEMEQTRFCVVDLKLRARDFSGGRAGSFAIQVISGPDIWAEKRFEVAAPPEPPPAAPSPAAPSEAPKGAAAGQGSGGPAAAAPAPGAPASATK